MKPTNDPTCIADAPCGCKVNGFNDKIGWHMEIAYCPLHAAAPELLIILKAEHFNYIDGVFYNESEKKCQVCKLIAKASGTIKP